MLEAATSSAGVLRIEFDRPATDEAAIRAAVQKIGVPKKPTSAKSSAAERNPAGKEREQAHGGLVGERTELVFATLCGGLLLIGWLLSVLSNVTPWVPWSLYLTAYCFVGFFMFREAIKDILALRFDIDALMLLAAIGCDGPGLSDITASGCATRGASE